MSKVGTAPESTAGPKLHGVANVESEKNAEDGGFCAEHQSRRDAVDDKLWKDATVVAGNVLRKREAVCAVRTHRIQTGGKIKRAVRQRLKEQPRGNVGEGERVDGVRPI